MTKRKKIRNNISKFKNTIIISIFIILTSRLLFGCVSTNDEIKEFTTDGCSGFVDGTLKKRTLWRKCCEAHDYDYWKGGTSLEREQSDLRLEKCVADLFEPVLGRSMRNVVRVFGTPYLPTSFRWGYGWRFPKGYARLSEQEHSEVERKKGNVGEIIQSK